MNEADASARTLLEQAQDRSIQGRRRLAAVTRDLFAPARSVLSDRAHALMSGIVGKLVDEFEGSLRRLLEETLAQDPEAMADSPAGLGEDEIGAARPILAGSGLLAEPGLVEAAWNRAREHLLAAALRTQPGDDDPIQSLLDHANGEIAEATKAYLVEEARRVDSYQEPLLRLRDLDPALTGRLATAVAAALRSHLREAPDLEPAALDAALETACRTLNAQLEAESGAAPAADLAALLQQADAITVALLVQVLGQGEVALFEALFGRLSALAAPRLQRVLYEPTGQDLALACRALDLDEAAFGELAALLSLAPAARLGEAAAQPANRYTEIDRAAAQDVLAYWRRDPAYLEAIERIQEAREEP